MKIRLIPGIAAIALLTACGSLRDTHGGVGSYSAREQIVEVVNKLFVYTDERDWNGLITEVFDGEVVLDMVSLGASAVETKSSEEITELWNEAFKGIDAIHHQAGNYIVDIEGDLADVKAYSIASHYKSAATEGKIREFIGSYDLGLIKKSDGWRINQFKYNLKYLDGNVELK